MKLFKLMKDGGPDSLVWGYFLAEVKSWFTAVLLKFENGTREVYHSHAFNSISWVVKGKLEERHLNGDVEYHTPSLRPVRTKRSTFHQVYSHGTTWVISFRGPWVKTWYEYEDGDFTRLQHGRVKA